VRPAPATSPEELARQQARADAYEAKLQTGGFNEALIRALLYAIGAEALFDQRCALALNIARERLMGLSLAEFKTLVRDQFLVLQLEPERAVLVLASLVPAADARKKLLKEVQMVVQAGGTPIGIERERLALLSQMLAVSLEGPPAAAKASPSSAVRQADQPATTSS
jgi:hypothetical protein